jgi:cation transport regulator
MPYNKTEDLPGNIKNKLPRHAQEIYLSAFNSAYEQYKDPEDRRGNESIDETAHKVAWNAVKSKYEKRNDEWVEK